MSKNLLARLTGKTQITVAKASEQLAAAQRTLEAAQQRHREAVFANAEGNAEAGETNAEQALDAAERAVRRAEIVLEGAQAAAAKAEQARQLEADKAQDRALHTALDRHAATGAKLAGTLANLNTDFQDHYTAERHVRDLMAMNPRVRPDLLNLPGTNGLIGQELARLAGTKPLPPGGNAYSRVTGDPTKLQPFVDVIAQDHRAIRAGLHNV